MTILTYNLNATNTDNLSGVVVAPLVSQRDTQIHCIILVSVNLISSKDCAHRDSSLISRHQ